MIFKEIKFYLAENVKNDVGNLNKNMTTCLELFLQTNMANGGDQKDVEKEDQDSEWMRKSGVK